MIIFTDGKSAIKPLDILLAECIKKYSPKAIYLREKDLSDEEYTLLASKIKCLCEEFCVDLYICHRADIARQLGIKNLHINCKNLSKIGSIDDFYNISVAIHSVEEIDICKKQGGTRVVFGHIFDTMCKQGLPARGLEKLKEICRNCELPVVAIGGINACNCKDVLECGAHDFAIMSSAMKMTF